jgi:NAD+ kinase
MMINHISIVVKPNHNNTDFVKTFISCLDSYFGDTVIDVQEYNLHQTHKQNTLFIALGEDRTMLTAMRLAAWVGDCSVIGIHMGKLGFLTDFKDDNPYDIFQEIIKIVNGTSDWKLNKRWVISTNVYSVENTLADRTSARVYEAVNEVLITTPTRKSPITCDICVNGDYVSTPRGDGIIVATATGSTAYALSAGGAIVAPTSRSMQIVPLAALTLSSRPIMIDGSDEIEVTAHFHRNVHIIQVYVDGLLRSEYLEPPINSMQVKINISANKIVRIWKPANWNFFDVLSEKMGWRA